MAILSKTAMFCADGLRQPDWRTSISCFCCLMPWKIGVKNDRFGRLPHRFSKVEHSIDKNPFGIALSWGRTVIGQAHQPSYIPADHFHFCMNKALTLPNYRKLLLWANRNSWLAF